MVGCGRAGDAFQVLTGCWGVGTQSAVAIGHAARSDVVRMQCMSTVQATGVGPTGGALVLTRIAGRAAVGSAGYGDGALTSPVKLVG